MGLGAGESRFSPTNIINLTLRALQLIFACAVIGLYAQDLKKAHKVHKYANGRWGFATVVSSLSAITALIFAIITLMMSYLRVALLFAWDCILFVLWVAVFGLFGSMYIHEHPKDDGGVSRMKNAVWVDLVCMLLWLISAVLGAFYFLGNRGNRSLHTGRARV